MFWKRPHEQSSAVDELRDSLSDRLRLVFDFATLGAYDDESDEQPAAPTDHAAELSAALRRQAERAERSSKNTARAPHRPVPQPHTQASPSPCDRASAGGTCSAAQSAAVATLARRPARAAGRRPRPGAVPVAQQPCTWTGS